MDEAISCYRKDIEVNPGRPCAHIYLGNALLRQGKLDEAIACCRRAIELDPEYAEAHAHLGVALRDQGNLHEAIACFRKAIELNPKPPGWYGALARCLATADDVKLRNPTEAIELARTAVQLDPKPWHWNTLSVAAYRTGDWKTSLDARQEQLQHAPVAAAEDRLFLAMTHWQLGSRAEARKWYDEAITQIAKDKALDTKLGNLRQEAEQLLGITTPRTPPSGDNAQPAKPQPSAGASH